MIRDCPGQGLGRAQAHRRRFWNENRAALKRGEPIDLRGSPADAIGAMASYFKGYGWQTGMPTHYPVQFDDARLDLETLMLPDILPTFSVGSFTEKGAALEGPALEHAGPLALVELQNGEAPITYVAGTENFYVITRYNQSSYYAMAVIELGAQSRLHCHRAVVRMTLFERPIFRIVWRGNIEFFLGSTFSKARSKQSKLCIKKTDPVFGSRPRSQFEKALRVLPKLFLNDH